MEVWKIKENGGNDEAARDQQRAREGGGRRQWQDAATGFHG
jgi:hypothetical protein